MTLPCHSIHNYFGRSTNGDIWIRHLLEIRLVCCLRKAYVDASPEAVSVIENRLGLAARKGNELLRLARLGRGGLAPLP